MQDIKVYGRYPGTWNKLVPENITYNLGMFDNTSVLRLDDKENLDMWLEIHIPKEVLEKMLAEINS